MADTLLYYIKSLKSCTFEEQVKILEKIGEKFGQSSQIFKIIGDFAFIEQLNELAAYCYEKSVLLEYYKQNIEIYERLGYLYYTSNGFNLALGIAYLLRDFNHAPYYLKYIIQDLEKLAQIYYNKGQFDMYFNCYKIILDFIPENLDKINQLFEMFRNSNEIHFTSMINPRSLELITHYFPDYSHAYSSLAYIEFKNRNYSKAEALINKFIEKSKINIQDYMHDIDDFNSSILISDEYDKKSVDLINKLFNPFKKVLSNRELWSLIQNQEWRVSVVDYDYFELLAIKAFNQLINLLETDIFISEYIKRENILSIFSRELIFLERLDKIKEIEADLSSRFQFSSDPLTKSHQLFNRQPLHENYSYTPDFSFNILIYSIVLYIKNPELSMTILKNLMIKMPKGILFQALFIYNLYHFIINNPINPNLCNLVLKELPDIPLGYLQMAFLESNRGNQQNAIEWIWQSLRVDPFNLKIWFVLSEFYNKIGNIKGQNIAIFTADYLMNNATLKILKKRLLLSQNSLDIFVIDEDSIKKKIEIFKSSNQPKSNLNSIEELFLDKFIKDLSNLNNLGNEQSNIPSSSNNQKELDDDISNILEFLKVIIDMDEIDKNKITLSRDKIHCVRDSLERIENYEYFIELDQRNPESESFNPDLISSPRMKQLLKSINRFEFIDYISPQITEISKKEDNESNLDRLYEDIIEQLVSFIKAAHWNSLKFTNFKRLAFSILIDTIKEYSKKSIYRTHYYQFFKPLYRHYLAIAIFLKDNLNRNRNEISNISKKIIEYTKEPLFSLIDILSCIDEEEYTNAMEMLNDLRLKYPHIRLLSALQLYIFMKINPSKIFIELFTVLYKEMRDIPYLGELYNNIIKFESFVNPSKEESISIFKLKDSQRYLNDFIYSIRTMNIQKANADINKCIITESHSFNNMINYCFFHAFFGNSQYAIEFLISNIILQKKPIESFLVLSLIYMYENNYKNFFDLIELVLHQMDADLRPLLLYLLVMIGQKRDPSINRMLSEILSKIKFKNHLTEFSNKYYFICMGLLNYLNKAYDESLTYLENFLQIYEFNHDIINLIIKNIVGEILTIRRRYFEACDIFSSLISDIESNFSKLNYSIIRKNNVYIVFDVLSALIALKLVYAQVMTKNYYSAIKNAYALLNNPVFQHDIEILCGLLSFSYYSLNKLGSALYYLTQKVKTLKSTAHLRLLILIYLDLADYQKVYELSIKYINTQKSDEFVLEAFLRSIIELQKYNEGISYLTYINSFPENNLLKYFKAVILYYNKSLNESQQIFLDLANRFPKSINIKKLLENWNSNDNNNIFKIILIEIEGNRYKNLTNNEPSKFLMDIFEYQETSINNYYQMKNKSIVDLIHLLLNVMNPDEEDTRIPIEEFELLAQKKEFQEEYQKYVRWESKLHPTKQLEHDKLDFWIFLIFEIYSMKSEFNTAQNFKEYLAKYINKELEWIENTNFVCFIKYIAICEYYLIFEPEQAPSVIVKILHRYPLSYGIIGLIFLLKHGILDKCEISHIMSAFQAFIEDPEGSASLIRYLELHDIVNAWYYLIQNSNVDESIKLIFSFIELFYAVYYSKSNIRYLASLVLQRIDYAKNSPGFSSVKEIILKSIQTDNILNKYYKEIDIMRDVIEKIIYL